MSIYIHTFRYINIYEYIQAVCVGGGHAWQQDNGSSEYMYIFSYIHFICMHIYIHVCIYIHTTRIHIRVNMHILVGCLDRGGARQHDNGSSCQETQDFVVFGGDSCIFPGELPVKRRETWRLHTCDMTHSFVWHDSFECGTWLWWRFLHLSWRVVSRWAACMYIYMYMEIYIYIYKFYLSISILASFLVSGFTMSSLSNDETRLIHMCDMTHSYVWHNPFEYGT